MAREEAALEIRPLTVADAPAFFALRLFALRESPDAFGQEPQEFEQGGVQDVAGRLAPLPGERLTLGAFLPGEAGPGLAASRLVAMAVLTRVTTRARGRHRASVSSVYAAPAARGRGVTAALMHALIAEARGWPDITQLELTVTLPETAANRLYRRLGFRVWAVQPRAMMVRGQPVDEELMLLRLDAPAG